MLYRCRSCGAVESRGCLPPATCLLYLLFLGCLSVTFLSAGLTVARRLIGPEPSSSEPEPVPWWFWVIFAPVGFILVVVGGATIHALLRAVEYLIVRRKPCPACGAKKWSWGYTAGFGL